MSESPGGLVTHKLLGPPPELLIQVVWGGPPNLYFYEVMLMLGVDMCNPKCYDWLKGGENIFPTAIAGLHFNVVCGGANMIPWTGVSLPGLVFASLCDFLQVSLLNLASVSSS